MTQILKPTDAMIEAGYEAAGSARYWISEERLSAIYTAMESARDPDELREALVERVARDRHNAKRRQIIEMGGLMVPWDQLGDEDKESDRAELREIDTALSRNVGDAP